MWNCAYQMLCLPMRACYLRKWFLLACLSATVIYGAVSLSYAHGTSSRGPKRVNYFGHGWPFEYACRQSTESWWRIDSGIYEFRYVAFLADMAIAFAFSLFLTCLWHRHCVRYKPWQFSTREMLTATLIVSLLFGTFAKSRSDFERNAARLSELREVGWGVFLSGDCLPWYYRPLRDIGVTSEDDWDLQGIDWVSSWNRGDERNINEVLSDLSSRPLSFVAHVSIVDRQLTDEGVESLCRWAPDCPTLYLVGCPNVTDRGIASITSHLPHLSALEVYGAQITDESVQGFAQMRSLEWLKFNDMRHSTRSSGIKSLLALPRLRKLGIPSHWSIGEDVQKTLKRRGIETTYIEPDESGSEVSDEEFLRNWRETEDENGTDPILAE